MPEGFIEIIEASYLKKKIQTVSGLLSTNVRRSIDRGALVYPIRGILISSQLNMRPMIDPSGSMNSYEET